MSAKKETAKPSKTADLKQKIIDSSLALAVEQGWDYTTLRDVAEHAGISMADLYAQLEDKNDILVLIGRMIDRRTLEQASTEEEGLSSPRDRLFDLLMDRYDILNEYREGLCAILESFKYDPKQIIISMPHLCRSMSWMLEAAGIETSGVTGAVKVTGITGVYLKVLKVWIEDESEDLSKTMAALDKALERAERAANTFGF